MPSLSDSVYAGLAWWDAPTVPEGWRPSPEWVLLDAATAELRDGGCRVTVWYERSGRGWCWQTVGPDGAARQGVAPTRREAAWIAELCRHEVLP